MYSLLVKLVVAKGNKVVNLKIFLFMDKVNTISDPIRIIHNKQHYLYQP